MNNEFVKQVARDNWHFLLAIAAIFGVIAFKLLGGGADPAQAATAAKAPIARAERAATTPPRDIVAEERDAARAVTLAKIKENEAALASNAEPEKASAYITGIGNMYFQRLQDYAAAASHYERAISDYPDAPAIYQTYVQLALCYERLGDHEKRKSTLRRMMESFPGDSQEYAYAYLELYGEMPPKAAKSEAIDSASDGGPLAAEKQAEKISIAQAQ